MVYLIKRQASLCMVISHVNMFIVIVYSLLYECKYAPGIVLST